MILTITTVIGSLASYYSNSVNVIIYLYINERDSEGGSHTNRLVL